MHEHVEEIQELYRVNDEHFLIEVGDLAVLCFELLLENNASIDETLLSCFNRYEKKLNFIIQEKNNAAN